ncbi:hypothetical protein ACJMK2_016756 [Sinanodonta woodiana]|uniref:Succinate--CoA ligase [GDP-forming] subunit beta, mitochondrial n=1 Tax=Sinanodonta woodiana TaxID=1069815 RepID=A0ABD3UY28_SINWO
MAAPMNMWLNSTLRSSRLANRVKLKGSVWTSLVRCLHLQEYQSKKLLLDHDIDVQHFEVVENAEEAASVSNRLQAAEYVIKAQILAGGRGRGTFSNGFKGGVHLTKNPKKIPEIVKNMIGFNLVTKQTHDEGVKVKKVMVAEALDIVKETYFAIVLDRTYNGPVIVGSRHGGMDIEEMSHKDPESIFKEPIDIIQGIQPEQAQRIAEKLGFTGDSLKKAAYQVTKLYNFFIDVDATQVEINPFAETPEGRVVCFDAKISFDDNAEFRQKEIFAMDDLSETDPREVEATLLHLNYIGLEGSIGCLVNGAGLAMATMDIIKLQGGEPANFLDVGGAVREDQVYNAFRLLTADAHVKGILVNVFGGIVNCITVANGIISACKKAKLTVPLVVRLEGTNSEPAKKILHESGLNIIPAGDFEDAGRKAVAAVSKCT